MWPFGGKKNISNPSFPMDVELIFLLLSKVGFLPQGPSHMKFFDKVSPESLYDRLAVGWMPHCREDDGAGYAGDRGFFVEIYSDTPGFVHEIALPVAKDCDRLYAMAKQMGLRFDEVLLEASERYSSSATARREKENSSAREESAAGVATEEAWHPIAEHAKAAMFSIVKDYDEGAITSRELHVRLEKCLYEAVKLAARV